ncbi:MAG: S9 family peptidase [Bacteroidetes bacterium]|nr:S9 family peptidase [Bacteroidota bacterium]
MRNLSWLIVFALLFACNKKPENKKIVYPETKKVNQVDDYFGTEVADPYRWLENDTSSETAEWVAMQNDLTRAYLDSLPYLEKIKDRLTQLWDYPRQGVPVKGGNNYVFGKNDGLQAQSVLYIMKGLDSIPEIFLDPNKLSDDGTVALSSYKLSKNGNYFAYAISRSGSDWNEIYIMDVESKSQLTDHLEWVKFSGISWHGDGFYYSRYPAPKSGTELSALNQNHSIYYHQLGTDQSDDILVFNDPLNPSYSYYGGVTYDNRFMLVYGSESTNGNSLRFRRVQDNSKDFKLIDEGFNYNFNVVDNIGDSLLILTNKGASNYRLAVVDTKDPDLKLKDLIPQQDFPLQRASVTGGKIFAQYMKDATDHVFMYDLNGSFIKEIDMPGPGSISGFSGHSDDSLVFYSYTSFISPSSIYLFDVKKQTSELYFESEINFDFREYESKQVFISSKDGTQLPLFITHKKDIKLDGNNPVLLYGYGGFNISLSPSFSITNLVFLEHGGIYAMACLRGGGEYGEDWHKAGMRLNKQNVFDDFISAAEYLINKKYTKSDKMAIRGASNGGLLVGACLEQRPDLFKVALPAVGVMDMLRYQRFSAGVFWVDEYGSSDEKEMFDYIYRYSPLHNIKSGVNYPATLVTTADHDDRVVPAHSFKFIATLQEHQKSTNPVLIRISEKAGHGSGKPTQKIIEEYADMWTFVFKNLNIKVIY